MAAGIDLDEGVGLVIGVEGDGLDGAYGKAAGVDLIAAGGEDFFAGLDAGVGGEVVDDDAAGGGAADDGADAGAGEQDAGAGGLVVDEQDLCGVGEDVAELADDAVGGDDGLIGLEAFGGAFVDVDDAGELGAAGADDLGGDGLGDVVLLKVEESLEAVALEGVLGDGGLLDAELGELLLEGGVLAAGGAQVDVVRPAVAKCVAGVEKEALEWRDGGDGPVTNERDTSSIRRDGVGRPSHLNRESDGLGEQHCDED